ncbi:DUF4148 domain-containing protein [Variovorax sp. LT2P21]|uniref:DUF4148 domain-containing protein n=1 Tax=Variovorax sp. LT2P21 TaxID=3443731 RepID=UPI003F47AA77
MQAKQLLALTALVAAAVTAGTAAAQTVPAEAWVGTPITATGAVNRADVAADLQRNARVAAAAPEAWVGTQASAGIAAGSLSRAEVQADLNLWRRAGLETASLADTNDSTSPAHAKQVAAYQRARQSGVYTAELQRVQGATGSAAAGQATPAAQ